MRAHEFLTEYRRAGDKFPKQAAIDILRKYKDQDDVYISFTKIDKLGLNPKSEYDTPIGIYSYPLKAAWENYNIDQDGIGGFPFASHSPYIWVFKGAIPDFCTVSPQQYIDIKRDLIEIYGEEKVNDANPTIDDLHKKNYGSQLWGLTRTLTDTSTQWTKLLLTLGFNGLSDKKGYGFIHTNERCQAVFFTVKGIEILEKIKNNREMKTQEEITTINQAKEYLNNASNEEQLEHIKHIPVDIKFIKNPSEEMQLAAIEHSPFTLKFIKNPSEKVLKYAVSRTALNLKHIKNPSEKIQELATIQNPQAAILIILNKGIIPSDNILKLALSRPQTTQAITDILKKHNIKFDPYWAKW